MEIDELNKLKEYRDKCYYIHHSRKEECLPNELEAELFELVSGLIQKYDWEIIADDTHRWVDTDGWYEVSFNLDTHESYEPVYINTICGDRELEDTWSIGNPQKAELDDCGLDYHSWDWYYFLDNLVVGFEEK